MAKTEELMEQYQRAVGDLPDAMGEVVREHVSEHLRVCAWFEATLAPRGCRVTRGSEIGASRMVVGAILDDERGLGLPRPELLTALLYGVAVDLLQQSLSGPGQS